MHCNADVSSRHKVTSEQAWIGKLQLSNGDFYVQDCGATLVVHILSFPVVFHLGQVEKVPIHQVASDWAVTAAHCLVDRRPSEMILQLGNEFSVDADDTAGNATFRWEA